MKFCYILTFFIIALTLVQQTDAGSPCSGSGRIHGDKQCISYGSFRGPYTSSWTQIGDGQTCSGSGHIHTVHGQGYQCIVMGSHMVPYESRWVKIQPGRICSGSGHIHGNVQCLFAGPYGGKYQCNWRAI